MKHEHEREENHSCHTDTPEVFVPMARYQYQSRSEQSYPIVFQVPANPAAKSDLQEKEKGDFACMCELNRQANQPN
jgi:hypothetical protein